MKLIGIINGWTAARELWPVLLWPPLRIHRYPARYETEDGNLATLEAPAVYSLQMLGVVLFIELHRGLRA